MILKSKFYGNLQLVDLCHVDAEGNEIKEIMTFTGLGDFGARRLKRRVIS